MHPKPNPLHPLALRKYYPHIVLAIAALTRLPQMTWRSFDGDEGITLLFADLSYRQLFVHMVDLTLDRHPLLHYVLIKFWRDLAGDTDVALRLLPVLLGMLTVAIVYQIGRSSLGRGPAAVVALLFALNPLVVYQHQDIRMYAPALFLIALAVWLSLCVRDVAYPQKSLLFLIIAISAAIALNLHITAATVVPLIAVLLLRDIRQRIPWVETGVLGLIGLSILPYVYYVFTTGGQGGGAFDSAAWFRTLLGTAKTLFDSQSMLAFNNNELFLALLLLAITGIALWRNWQKALLPAFWLLTALVLLMFIMLSIETFFYKPFVFATIPLSYLIVIAFAGKRPLSNILPLAAFTLFFIAGLVQLWYPANVGEDFRSTAAFIDEQATEQDAVVIHLNWYQSALGHYLNRPVAAPFSNNVQSVDEVAAGFEPFLDANAIWLVQVGIDAAGIGLPGYQGDQERLVQTWLENQFPLVTEIYPGGISVKAYALDYRLPALPHTATPLDLTYETVNLVGYRLANDTFPTRDSVLHPPSTWIPTTLYWSVTAPLQTNVIPVITLEDDHGAVWGGNLSRENDLRRFYPPTAWQPGEVIRWDFDVVVNPEISPGVYKLVVRLLDGQTMTPIIHEGGHDWFILQQITLQK